MRRTSRSTLLNLICLAVALGLLPSGCRQGPSNSPSGPDSRVTARVSNGCPAWDPDVLNLVGSQYAGSVAYRYQNRLAIGTEIAYANTTSGWSIKTSGDVCLYWIDTRPSAGFAHKTVGLLLEEDTGRRVGIGEGEWWLEIDGIPWLAGATERESSSAKLPGGPPVPASVPPAGIIPTSASSAPQPAIEASGHAVVGLPADCRREVILILGETKSHMGQGAWNSFVASTIAWAKNHRVHYWIAPKSLLGAIQHSLAAIKVEMQSLTPPSSDPDVLVFHYIGHATEHQTAAAIASTAGDSNFVTHQVLANTLHSAFSSTHFVTLLDACYQGEAVVVFPADAKGHTPERGGIIVTSSGLHYPKEKKDGQCLGPGTFSENFVGAITGSPPMGNGLALTKAANAVETKEGNHTVQCMSAAYPKP